MPPGEPITYKDGERVLCYHGPLIYEAKILRSDNWTEENTQDGFVGPHFRVHYKGWKNTCVPDVLLCPSLPSLGCRMSARNCCWCALFVGRVRESQLSFPP